MATATTEEKKFFAFYSRIHNSTHIFPDGTLAAFTGGRYTTDDEQKAAHLRAEIKSGNQYLFLDEEKQVLTEAELDPMAELKARIIAEYEAKKASDTSNDMGESDSGKLNVADTSSIAQAAMGSDSGAVAATPGITLAVPSK